MTPYVQGSNYGHPQTPSMPALTSQDVLTPQENDEFFDTRRSWPMVNPPYLGTATELATEHPEHRRAIRQFYNHFAAMKAAQKTGVISMTQHPGIQQRMATPSLQWAAPTAPNPGQRVSSQHTVTPFPTTHNAPQQQTPSRKIMRCRIGVHEVTVPQSWNKIKCPACDDANAMLDMFENTDDGKEHVRTWAASSQHQIIDLTGDDEAHGPVSETQRPQYNAPAAASARVDTPFMTINPRQLHATTQNFAHPMAASRSSSPAFTAVQGPHLSLPTQTSSPAPTPTPQRKRAAPAELGNGNTYAKKYKVDETHFNCAQCGTKNAFADMHTKNNAVNCTACCNLLRGANKCVWLMAAYQVSKNELVVPPHVRQAIKRRFDPCQQKLKETEKKMCACTPPAVQKLHGQGQNTLVASKTTAPSASGCTTSDTTTAPAAPATPAAHADVQSQSPAVQAHHNQKVPPPTPIQLPSLSTSAAPSPLALQEAVTPGAVITPQTYCLRSSAVSLTNNKHKIVEVPDIHSNIDASTQPAAKHANTGTAAHSLPTAALIAALIAANNVQSPKKQTSPPIKKQALPSTKRKSGQSNNKTASAPREAVEQQARPMYTRVSADGLLLGPTGPDGYAPVLAANVPQPDPGAMPPPFRPAQSAQMAQAQSPRTGYTYRDFLPSSDAHVTTLLSAYLPVALEHVRNLGQSWASKPSASWQGFGLHAHNRDAEGQLDCRACENTGIQNEKVLEKIHDHFAGTSEEKKAERAAQEAGGHSSVEEIDGQWRIRMM